MDFRPAEFGERSRLSVLLEHLSAIEDARAPHRVAYPLAEIAEIIRGHWRIESQLHWTLDVVYNEDQSRLRKGHGAKNMAVVRHFAINLTRQAPEGIRPQRSGLRRKTNKPPAPRKTSIKLRRKIAGWDPNYLAAVLNIHAR